ncbi:MAG: hypothetical protein D6748_10075 [Calditrichaeota bacterium]|nr:MAG: hypothetical protein D6748_10075 [Calditrichota bacterium]
MKKYFAIADVDNSFIVSANTQEELKAKIEEIERKYSNYYHRFIEPGFHVVKASSIREAKTIQHRN